MLFILFIFHVKLKLKGDVLNTACRSTYLSPPFFWYACRQPGHCFECIMPLKAKKKNQKQKIKIQVKIQH